MNNNCCIYLRVSNETLNLDNQLPPLLRMAEQRNLTVVKTIEEKVTGSKRARDGLTELLRGAHRGEYSHVLVWAIDRLGRTQRGVIETIFKLDDLGCSVISHQETWLEMRGPMRGMLLGVFAWFAEQERARIIERTKAGIVTARAAGKKLGRPSAEIDLDEAYKLLKLGYSYKRAAEKLGVGTATLHRAVRESKA